MLSAVLGGDSGPLVEATGWMLVHSIWQGALVAGALVVINRLLMRGTAASRYVVNLFGLLLLLILPLVTIALLLPDEPTRSWPIDQGASGLRPVGASTGEAAHDVSTKPGSVGAPAFLQLAAAIQQHLDWVVALWIIGAVCVSLRLLAGWVWVQHLCAQAKPVAHTIRERARSLQRRVGVNRLIGVLESASIVVPTVVRSLRPCILVPIGFASGLTMQQVDAILLHELIHIRRHDYLINLLQRFAEILLFYHPATWWISRRIRIERECWCDDTVVELCGSRRTYVEALLQLETSRLPPRLALAATDGSLLSRVRRLTHSGDAVHHQRSTTEMTALPSLLAVLLVAILAGLTSVQPVSATTERSFALPAGGQSIEMVHVPAGEFTMGTTESNTRSDGGVASPVHQVELPAFWIGKTEVTVSQYQACSSAGDCAPADNGSGGQCSWSGPGNHPVNCLSWDMARDYCAWAGLRLPTEAEWERAARGTQGLRYPWGNDLETGRANYGGNGTTPVGEFPLGVSPSGAHDMAGNVWELVGDRHDGYDYDPPGGWIILRGGSWRSTGSQQPLLTFYRNWDQPQNRHDQVGFRCACDGETTVEIDIRPRSRRNPINLRSRGVIPVAILTTDSFDASSVIGSSVVFAGASPARGEGRLRDVDRDGDLDWIGYFRTQALTIERGDTEASLTASTTDGDVVGVDAIKVVGGRRGHDRGNKKPAGSTPSSWAEIKKSAQ